MHHRDTIVAVSSPPGRSWRGLVRVSGPGALALLDALVEREGAGRTMPPRVMHRATLRDPLPPIAVLVCCFHGPASYNGDDIAELQCPGNPALLERIAAQALTSGARLAEPGEFTYRAYLAGKLDLTEAEGIAATISAVSDAQLAAAAHLRHGELARFSETCVDRLGNLLALVEAGIDFVDQDDVVPIAPRKLRDALARLTEDIEGLLRRSRSWGAVEALPRVVLAGEPSVGKSTLFNALLGRTRSVVDAMPCTTRDVIEEPIELPGGGEVMLVDLAGLDEASIQLLDREAQRRAAAAIAQADLVLLLRDATAPAPAPGKTHRFAFHNANTPALHVWTKCDAPDAMTARDDTDDAVRVSAVMNQGLDDLRRAITARLANRTTSLRADVLALQPRHTAALHEALGALRDASGHVDPNAHALRGVELVAAAMRGALDALAGLGGRLSPDDVIGRVFATFCVGK